jgi:capsular exopolysaccharide synthesis family protein
MNEEPQPRPHDRSTAKSHLLAQLQRYKNLVVSKWWIVLLGPLLGGLAMYVSAKFNVRSYVSSGRMMVSMKLNISEASVYAEEMSSFLGTQAALMQSGPVLNRAYTRVQAQHPGTASQAVAIKVSVQPKTSIFLLQGTGLEPQFTQFYVQACMEEYINLKKEMRSQTSDTTVAGLTEEVLRLEKELRAGDQELTDFQSSNSVVVLQEQGNSAGSYLAALNQRLATLKSEYNLLQSLTLDQTLERQPQLPTGADANANSSSASQRTDADYVKAKQDILVLKSELKELSQFLKYKHPKIVALNEDIARRERLLEIFRQQSGEELESRKQSLALQIQNTERDVKESEVKNLELSRKSAEYQRLKAGSQRIQALYDRLLLTMQTLDVNKEISPESVTIMEKASPSVADQTKSSKGLLLGLLAGLGLSVLVLVILNRLDDTMNSFTELEVLFDEPVLGQIPKDRPTRKGQRIGLLEANDERHAFVEAYRNLRSSLLFMTESGTRPKTLLLTSSIPDDGKSLTSANFAITLASSGARVLLVDADLRKGALHRHFGVEAEPGLTEALADGKPWETMVHTTRHPNLSFLPRGALTHKSSEFFIGDVTKTFLQKAAAQYDYVIVDTAPVMAADDVTSLAPSIDAVLFVIRAEHTSARIARAALDLLYRRNVRVLGLVFNAVSPSSTDYYYYHQYRDYYSSYPTASTGQKPESRKG